MLKDFANKILKKNEPLNSIIKPVIFAGETIKLTRLLKNIQSKKTHFSVILDEYGGTMGIVTLEDIVEELVGEIWDEHDNVIELFKVNADGSFSVMCSANIEDMFDFIESHHDDDSDEEPPADDHNNKDQPEEADFSGATVGSWVMDNISGLPYVGDEFEWRNLHVRVSRVQRHRVMEIIVTCVKQASA